MIKEKKEKKARPVAKWWPDSSGYLKEFSTDLQQAIKNKLSKKKPTNKKIDDGSS